MARSHQSSFPDSKVKKQMVEKNGRRTGGNAAKKWLVFYLNRHLAQFLLGPSMIRFGSGEFKFKGVEFRSPQIYGVGWSSGMILVPEAKVHGRRRVNMEWKHDPAVAAVLSGDEFCGFPSPTTDGLVKKKNKSLRQSKVRLTGLFNISEWTQPTMRNYWNERGAGTVLLWPSAAGGGKTAPVVRAASSRSEMMPLNASSSSNDDGFLALPRYLPLGPRDEFPTVADEVE